MEVFRVQGLEHSTSGAIPSKHRLTQAAEAQAHAGGRGHLRAPVREAPDALAQASDGIARPAGSRYDRTRSRA
ncbi:Hypothetical Protein RSKD131_3198 [Cereibacter sphaeroides KD131]|nr:Hypothetical Protein RSKD131_3198 [Cereibacter sphaeroides KD131]